MSQQYEAHAASVAKRDPGHLLVAIDSSDGVSQAESPQAVIAAYHRVLADSAHTSWRHDSSPPLVMVLETGCVDGFCVSVSGHVQVNASPALPGNIHVNGGFVMGPAIAMREMWSTIATTNISCCHRGKMHPQLGMGCMRVLPNAFPSTCDSTSLRSSTCMIRTSGATTTEQPAAS